MKGTPCEVSLVCLCILDSSQLGCKLLISASPLHKATNAVCVKPFVL